MTTKEYLLSVKRLDNMINDKLDEIYRVKTRATNITVPCDKERVDGTHCNDRIGEQVTDIVEMEKDVDLLTDIRVDTIRHIKKICKQINPIHADILEKHYIDYLSFSQIGTIYGFKIGKTKYICKEAQKEFEKIFITTKCSIPIDFDRYM